MLLAVEEMMCPVRGLLAGQSPRAATVGAGPGAWRWYCGVAQRNAVDPHIQSHDAGSRLRLSTVGLGSRLVACQR